tara:strand:- start:528 stop:1970 length:1443 start_codon:yes stop_codon:yes gene_type:complete
MANELAHKTVGTELTQAEFELITLHVFDSQAIGDTLYASSSTQLSRLAIGSTNAVFVVIGGVPSWATTLAGLTLTTPTISGTGFENANHAHAAANSGGTVDASDIAGTTLASNVVSTSITSVGILASPVLTTPQINDASLDHQFIFAGAELTADRTVTLPILAGNDTFVFEAHTQTLTNKTLTSPVLTTPQINDTSADHQYIFAVSELVADRTVTLPLLTGADEFVFKDHAVTMTNKTLTSAVLNTAVSGTAVLDEDDLSSDSATQVATQQSIKAYVDAITHPVTAINSATENYLVSVGATTTELEAESTLTYDGTTLTLGSGQIAFPATQNASAGANTLDDYEEGTWTPHFADSSLSAGMEGAQAEDIAVGNYTKIGNRVFYSCRIRITALGDLIGVQQARILGLPYTSDSTSNSEAAMYCGTGTSMAITAGTSVAGNQVANSTRIELYHWSETTGISELSLDEVSAGAEMTFAGNYRI